jgi:hypothetical protein
MNGDGMGGSSEEGRGERLECEAGLLAWEGAKWKARPGQLTV